MTNVIGTYLSGIGKRKLLTHEQEIQLAQAIEAGQSKKEIEIVEGKKIAKVIKPSPKEKRLARRAQNKMIESNLRLVISVAKKFKDRGCDLEDLIAAGNEGLMKAVERFDWKRGFRFSTYGSWWIRQAIQREIAGQGKQIKVPGRTITLSKDLKNVREEFISLHGQEPTRSELASLLGVTEKTISAAITGAPALLSLDDTVGKNDDNRSLKDVIPDEESLSPFDTIDRKELISLIGNILSTLDPREDKILRMRFGISHDPHDHEQFPITKSELNAIANP